MNKVLTVSVAAYNVAATLREVLDPFLTDGVTDRVEVLIVNDGSKDATADIATEYQTRYPDTFRLITKENGGWGSTLNAGIRAASGKYFKQLDGDDYFSRENLPAFLDYLENCDSDAVHTPFVTYTDTNGGILNVLNDFRWQYYGHYPKEHTLPLEEFPDFQPEMHNLTVRTGILQASGIFITEHCFYTDVEFCLKAVCACKTVSFFERPIYYYRLAFRGQSMGLGGIRRHYRDNQKMLTGMLSYYEDSLTDQWAKELVMRRLTAVCDLMYRMYFALQCTGKQREELMEFDRMLLARSPELYRSVVSRPVQILRRLRFRGYWLIGHLKMSRDRRRRINFFEGE